MSSLSEFCEEFGVVAPAPIAMFGRRSFLVREDDSVTLKDVFGIGVYLGEEKGKFLPSPALVELIAAKNEENKVVVDERAAWLFLCGRDILDKGVLSKGKPTKNGLFLVQNETGENLGYGCRKKGMAVKNLLDRGFYLRRERLS